LRQTVARRIERRGLGGILVRCAPEVKPSVTTNALGDEAWPFTMLASFLFDCYSNRQKLAIRHEEVEKA
jgi:hypothetical protein